MYLGKPDVNSYDKGTDKEYFISNGHQDYSFSTIIGANVRKDHGLYISFDEARSDLFVHVAKLEEIVIVDGKKYNLSTNKYVDSIFPEGYRYLQEFYTSPFPVFLYVIHSTMIRKTIFMPYGKDFLVVKYNVVSSPHSLNQINIRPLMSHKYVGSACACDTENNLRTDKDSNNIIISSDLGSTFLNMNSGSWNGSIRTYDNIVYEKDELDGNSFVDKYWSTGYFSADASEGKTFSLIISKSKIETANMSIEKLEDEAKVLGSKIYYNFSSKSLNELTSDLFVSSSHLISKKKEEYSIMTGCPSFNESALSTFFSLPGLLLSTNKFDIADKIFDKWFEIAEKNDGVVPLFNRNTGHSGPSGDSGLIFIYALGKYVDKIGSIDKIKLNWDSIRHIVNNYLEEADKLGLVQGDSGLLELSSPELRSDWMNAKIKDQYIVERKGCLVESNALFYNALKTMEMFALSLGDKVSASFYLDNAEQVKLSISRDFWNADKNCLYDWISEEERDGTIRPNQILAVSLPYTALSPDQGKAVVQICWDHLYTTFGLRSLDPRDERFKGRFEGRSDQRLKARYRGMAWPWLLGHFISAFMRYYPKRSDVALTFTRPFVSHLSRGCLGGVAEFFDGTMPYNPHGDFLSSLSVGELLRVLDEDLLEFDRL